MPKRRFSSRRWTITLALAVGALWAPILAASSLEPLVLSNAYLDLSTSPPTVKLIDVHGAFGQPVGQAWQVVDGTPTPLGIVDWTELSIVAELASTKPGDYLIAVLPFGRPTSERALFRLTIPRDRHDPPCFDDSMRFADCGNGTVTDSTTGLTWMRHATCFSGTWAQANAQAAALQDGRCGLSDGSQPGDWRLPTRAEWQTLVDPSCQYPPKLIGNGPFGGCFSEYPWATGALVDFFWTSSTDASMTNHAYGADLAFGMVINYLKAAVSHPGWAVRDRD